MPNLPSQRTILSGVSLVLSLVLLGPPLLLQSPTQKTQNSIPAHSLSKTRHWQTTPSTFSSKPAPSIFFGYRASLRLVALRLQNPSTIWQNPPAKPATSATKPACIFRALTDKTCVNFLSISAANYWHAATRHFKKLTCNPCETRGKFAISARLFYPFRGVPRLASRSPSAICRRAAWPVAAVTPPLTPSVAQGHPPRLACPSLASFPAISLPGRCVRRATLDWARCVAYCGRFCARQRGCPG